MTLTTLPARETSLPEEMLRSLFAEEARLLAELERVREDQRSWRNAYAEAQGLLMRPGMDALRRTLAA